MATSGADVIAYKDNVKYVIQVKFYNNPVGNKAVQEVVGAIGMYKADKGIVVTNSTFTSSAIELAQANNIELINGDKIEEYKNTIVNNIDSKITDENKEEKEFMHNFIKLWKCAIEDFSNEDFEKKIMFLGTTYYSLEKNLCNMQKVRNFIELLIKYKYLDEEISLYVDNFKETTESLELFISAGVFTGYILEQLETREDDDYYETILDIYVNAPDIVEKNYQIVAVSKLLGLSIQDTANAIDNYINGVTDDNYYSDDYDDFDD